MRNIYKHKIELKKITIKNTERKKFAEQLLELPYRGYDVEEISDGRKIVITKPGGKSSYGKISKEDFLVFIYNPVDDTLWQITHKQILNELISKSEVDSSATLKIISALEMVYNGVEPDDAISATQPTNPTGELPEVLLKAYKWIWGQEDVNYPNHKGRAMSWESIHELKEDLE